jgi:hypothetical protein
VSATFHLGAMDHGGQNVEAEQPPEDAGCAGA